MAVDDESLRRLAKDAASIWSVGGHIYDYWESKYRDRAVQKRHRKLLPALNPFFADNAPDGPPHIGATSVNVLTVGRFTTDESDKTKGLAVLIDACTEVMTDKTAPNVHLFIRGVRHNDMPAVETLCRNKLRTSTFSVNEFDGQERVRNDLESQAGLFVLPSECEPFGLSALEAVAMRVPLVVAEVSGVAKTYSGAPFARVLDASKAGAWADAIRGVLSLSEGKRAEMVEESRKVCAENSTPWSEVQ